MDFCTWKMFWSFSLVRGLLFLSVPQQQKWSLKQLKWSPSPDSEPTWLFIKTKVKQRKEAIFHIKEAEFAAEEAGIRLAMCLCKFCGPLQSVIAMFKVWLICNHQKGKNSHVENSSAARWKLGKCLHFKLPGRKAETKRSQSIKAKPKDRNRCRLRMEEGR